MGTPAASSVWEWARSPAPLRWFVFVQQVDNGSIYRAKEVDVAALDRLLVQSAEPFPSIERRQSWNTRPLSVETIIIHTIYHVPYTVYHILPNLFVQIFELLHNLQGSGSGHIVRRFMTSIKREAVQTKIPIVKVISSYRLDGHMPRGARRQVRQNLTKPKTQNCIRFICIHRLTDKSSSLSAAERRSKQISSQINWFIAKGKKLLSRSTV